MRRPRRTDLLGGALLPVRDDVGDAAATQPSEQDASKSGDRSHDFCARVRISSPSFRPCRISIDSPSRPAGDDFALLVLAVLPLHPHLSARHRRDGHERALRRPARRRSSRSPSCRGGAAGRRCSARPGDVMIRLPRRPRRRSPCRTGGGGTRVAVTVRLRGHATGITFVFRTSGHDHASLPGRSKPVICTHAG